MIAVLVIAICAAAVAAGLVLVARHTREAPPALPPLRYAAVCLGAGLGAGAIAAGAGGRLVMRLLAVTSPGVEGAITEAEATIGEITAAGTLGFVIFVGLPAGALMALLYGLAGPLVRGGRAGGLALGAILLVLVGTNEPLRSDNFDFNLAGPDWLSVGSFVALALFQGMVAVAIAARLSGYAPAPLPAPARAVLAGRVAVGVVLVAALPAFLSAVTDILTSA